MKTYMKNVSIRIEIISFQQGHFLYSIPKSTSSITLFPLSNIIWISSLVVNLFHIHLFPYRLSSAMHHFCILYKLAFCKKMNYGNPMTDRYMTTLQVHNESYLRSISHSHKDNNRIHPLRPGSMYSDLDMTSRHRSRLSLLI